MSVLVAVTDHAAERFRQRIGSAGMLDVKPEVARRVADAWARGRWSREPPAGIEPSRRGSVYVSDLVDRSLVFICLLDGAEVLVITLWERDDAPIAPKVPRRFTDALEQDDERGRDRRGTAR